MSAFRPYHKRKTFSGVSRTVRDSYGSWSEWGAMTKEVAKRDGKACFDCGTSDPSKGFETHHILPLSRGGTTSKSNLKYLCFRCHDRKHPHHTIARGSDRKGSFRPVNTAAKARAKRIR